MNAILPYIFFLYMFISSWILLMNYKTIREFSSSERSAVAFISLCLSIYTFVGVATMYHMEHLHDDCKELINTIY